MLLNALCIICSDGVQGRSNASKSGGTLGLSKNYPKRGTRSEKMGLLGNGVKKLTIFFRNTAAEIDTFLKMGAAGANL